MLGQMPFSDLLLLPSGRSFLKGGPVAGLVVCGPDMREQVATLLAQATAHWRESGQASFRMETGGVLFRVAVLQNLEGPAFFLRRMPEAIPDFAALGLPQTVTQWLTGCACRKGLVLFCGAQGSGKTTSASALIASRLRQHGGHGVTFEAPAEMPLHGQHGPGFCFQSELSDDNHLARATQSAHRFASPDILFIGEIRSRHAAAQVLRAALGSDRQMVIATIHGLDLVSSLDRLLTFAREADGDIAAQNLAQTLTAVLFQCLTVSDGQAHVELSEFLLLPFTERAKSVRAKLRSGNLLALPDDIREQKNRLAFGVTL